MRNIIFITFLFTITISSGQEMDCDKFKTGVFIDSSTVMDVKTRITRYEEYQIEEDLALGVAMKSKITWLNDCPRWRESVTRAIADSLYLR